MSLVESFPLLGFLGKIIFFISGTLASRISDLSEISFLMSGKWGKLSLTDTFLWGVETIYVTIHDGNHTKAATANKIGRAHV